MSRDRAKAEGRGPGERGFHRSKLRRRMKTFGADDIRPEDPIWVWDGCWLPVVVADVVLEADGRLVIVRFENGCSAPASAPDLTLRNPDARGSDRPRFVAPSRLDISRNC